jgi:hypothetical protein
MDDLIKSPEFNYRWDFYDAIMMVFKIDTTPVV